jgi:hypothetical protein
MAVILLQLGVFNTTLFTLVAAVGLLTTIISPIGAMASWESDPKSREELYRRVPILRPGITRSRAFQPYFPYGPLDSLDRIAHDEIRPPPARVGTPGGGPPPRPLDVDPSPPPLPDPKRVRPKP